jgi:parallel beta-helix repeat protein
MKIDRNVIFRYLVLLFVLALCINTVSGAEIRVGESETYSTITEAYNNASNYDVIIVGDGIYTENISIQIPITIRSENGSASTIIQPGSGTLVFNITANNVTIDGFNITNGTGPTVGILADSVSNCTIINNEISQHWDAIIAWNSNNITLMNNSLSSNLISILLIDSINCTLSNNTMSSTSYNFGVLTSDSDNLEYYLHNIDSSNQVNGKVLYYLVNEANIEVPSDAGQVYAVNSQNITIRDLVVGNGLDGVALINTSNSTIENVTVSGCYEGILLLNSEYNLVRNVTAVDNDAGIHNHNSSNNMLLNNIINDSFDGGIFLCGSDDVALVGNSVSGNYNGISIWRSNSSWLQDNIVQFNEDHGIEIEESNNATLIGNTVNYNAMDGIFIYGSYNSSLDDNIVNYNSEVGIRAHDIHDSTLTGNTANENARAGIYVYTSTNITLTDNTADDSTGYYSIAAIEMQDIEPQNLEMVSLSEVKRHSKSTTNMVLSDDSMSVMAIDRTSYGIRIDLSEDVTLINNHATGSEYQLRAARSENLLVDNVVITEKSAGISFAGNFDDISLSETFSVPASPSGKTNVNGYVNLSYSGYESLGISGYSGPSSMNITLSYDDSGMSSAKESSISIFSLDGSTWVRVPNATLSTSNNRVSATVTGEDIDVRSILISYPTAEITLALFKDSERTGSSGSSVIARERSQGTITDLPLGNDGGLTKDTVVKSSDLTTTLTLFTGTKALDPLGNPVNSIIVTTPSSLPSDTPREVIESGLYFRFGPSGTTFSQDVMITMDFDPELFEGRVPVIYTYTSEEGWIALETTVDWENGRATAMISHFSLYALFGTDSEETQVIVVETQEVVAETFAENAEEKPVEDKGGFGYLYWIIGVVIVLALGIAIVKKQKDSGGL